MNVYLRVPGGFKLFSATYSIFYIDLYFAHLRMQEDGTGEGAFLIFSFIYINTSAYKWQIRPLYSSCHCFIIDYFVI